MSARFFTATTSRLRNAAVAVAIVGLTASSSTAAGAALDGTTVLPLAADEQASEPHLAINPNDPTNILVVAHASEATKRVGPGTTPPFVRLAYWSTSDGGASWTKGYLLDRDFEGSRAFGSDPVAAFGPDGTAYYAGMVLPTQRRSWESLVVMGSSTDGGRSFPSTKTLIRTKNRGVFDPGEGVLGSIINDKEWIAVDQTGGPFSGTVYSSWDRVSDRLQNLVSSRLPPGAAEFTTPTLVKTHAVFSQIAVRPDGTVDLVWIKPPKERDLIFRPSSAKIQIVHAASTDGGANFSPANTIAELKGTDTDIPTLATSGSGRLLACWPETNLRDIERDNGVDPVPSQIKCANSADGQTWTQSISLFANEPGLKIQRTPIAAAQGERFWVSVYGAGKSRTRVILYRSDDGGASFARERTLASRKYGYAGSKFYGDYTGLAATADRVVAAYVLADRDKPRSRTQLFVTSFATQ